jgi:crossover junction endodeoxyribonuclease RuvC
VKALTVIGIDPGSRCTGWGVVREESGVLRLVGCGTVRATETDFSARLAFIYHELAAVVSLHSPEEAAAEQVFSARNPATALKLGQARGVALAACAAHGLIVRGYAPAVVKKTLVGTGSAEKSQVSFMVGRLLNVRANWPVDAGDALAVAVCHLTVRRVVRRIGNG